MLSSAPQPTVTIALPVYNGERFLKQALDSLLNQTYRDFELIIGDNASSDATRGICAEACSDPRVRYLRSPENRGAAWNYNRLLPEASGRYFKWAAHDDVYQPTWLERCVEALEADDGVVLAYTRTIEIDEHDRELERYRALPYASGERASERVREVLGKRSRCFEAFGLARIEALRTTGLIGPYTSSDRTLIMELALRGRFYEVPEPLFLHRQHPGRSVRVYADARERQAWFVPGQGRKRVRPNWRLLWEYERATWRAPVGLLERLRTNVWVGAWIARNAGELRGDLIPPRRSSTRAAAASAVGR